MIEDNCKPSGADELKTTMSAMYNDICKLSILNRHTDGSHETIDHDIEAVQISIHNHWVVAQDCLTSQKARIEELEGENKGFREDIKNHNYIIGQRDKLRTRIEELGE